MAQTEQSVGHIKGPWSVKVAFGRRGFNIMSPPVGGRTFRLFTSDHATADDALAAAAAPELLEALKALRLQALQSDLNDPANEWGWEALQLANAAIARATGASS